MEEESVLVPVSQSELPQTSPEPNSAVTQDKDSPTVVFIPPENGKLGNSLLSSSVRLLQTIDGAVISFRDVCYQVQVTVRTRGCRCRKEPKHILKNVRLVRVCLNRPTFELIGHRAFYRGVQCSIGQWTPFTLFIFAQRSAIGSRR